MVESIIVFLFVCAVVWIVHSFLRAAEQPEDAAREKHFRERDEHSEPQLENSRRPQWAH